MSLLIDVLTKADQANSEEPDRAATASPDAEVPDTESELSLAPDDDTAAAVTNTDAEESVADTATAAEVGGGETRPVWPGNGGETRVPAAAAQRAESRLSALAGTPAFRLAAVVAVAVLAAAGLFIGDWLQTQSLTPASAP